MAIKSFLFSSVPNILYELGSSVKVGGIAKKLGCKSVVVVTDPGLRKLGLTDTVVEGIERQGLKACVFDKIVEDPPESIVKELIEFSKSNDADGVVGVGGGSSMDAAKLAAFMCGDTKQQISEIYGVDFTVGRRLPLIQVPTTAGTGSEVTNISVITTGVAEKKGVVGPQLYADYAVLDGDLTLTLPPKVTAATGIDAMVHAIEAYTSKIKKNVLSDVLAREALHLLSTNIKRVCEDGNDREARGSMLLGSLYAGMAFANSPCAAVHALAYPIGSHFHVPHGLSNSLMLPHVLRFTGENPAAGNLYRDLTPIIFPALASLRGNGVSVLADGYTQLAKDLAIPTCLEDVGIKEKDLELLSTEASKIDRLLQNNMREVTLQDAFDLYSAALKN
eukprot:GFUD01008250.1.p1 GENE.GFUD01008250.1~~GFUD01008250.1.p1  ORF type:complete len:404 (+),score=89.24 GFUD01008250.1:42-1214(+)